MQVCTIQIGIIYFVLWSSYELNAKEIAQAKNALKLGKKDLLPAGVRAFPCETADEAIELANILERK
jgi:hypothetical protein